MACRTVSRFLAVSTETHANSLMSRLARMMLIIKKTHTHTFTRTGVEEIHYSNNICILAFWASHTHTHTHLCPRILAFFGRLLSFVALSLTSCYLVSRFSQSTLIKTKKTDRHTHTLTSAKGEVLMMFLMASHFASSIILSAGSNCFLASFKRPTCACTEQQKAAAVFLTGTYIHYWTAVCM